MATVICPHCGVNNRSGSNFCNNCGTTLREEDHTPPEQSGESASEQQSATAQSDAPTTLPDQESGSLDSARVDSARDKSGRDKSERDKSATDADGSAENPQPTQRPQETDSQPKNEPTPPEADEYESFFSGQTTDADATQNRPQIERKAQSALARGLPGLLEPQTIVGQNIDVRPNATAADSGVDDVDLRRIRTLMTSEPKPSVETTAADETPPTLHIPWVFALLGLALAIPIFFGFTGPTGAPYELSGVEAAFSTIDQLNRPAVLLIWAYDPATAGELDQVAEPVLRHLEAKGNQILLASTLPFGPATARSLLSEVQDIPQRTESNVGIELGYLPGGAAVLPLLGQARTDAVAPGQQRNSALLDRDLDLVLIVSAQAEEVQQWIEQGQPLNQTRVIAVTSAGAGPYLRPYLDSGQLSGLVSGFDGGISYQRLVSGPSTLDEQVSDAAATLPEQQFRQLVYQNWGHFAILVLIVLGNFSMLNNRNRLAAATNLSRSKQDQSGNRATRRGESP